jgi:hypothetical protein
VRSGASIPTVLVALAACHPSPPPVETPDHPPTVAAPAPARDDAPILAPTLADVPKAATIPATPFPPDALVIAWPSEQQGITLFVDERARVREAIATKLRTGGRVVASVEELTKIEEAAATGVLELEGGQRCRAPLSRAEVEDRYFRKHSVAYPAASCGDNCRLDVSVFVDGKLGDSWVRERVRKPEDPRSWIAAAGKLVPSEESVGSLEGYGAGKELDIQFHRVDTIGPWKGELAATVFDPLDPELVACADRDAAVAVTHALRSAVAPDGTIERCEHELETPGPRPGVVPGECLCGVLRKLKLARGGKGRRFRVMVEDRGAPFVAVPRVRLGARQQGIDPWITRFVDAGVIERCQAQGSPTEAFVATLGIPLAPDGAAGPITVIDAGSEPASKTFVACVVAGLAKVALPCAPPGLPELRVALTVELKV